ncbi:MAG TPA: hypothetical protein DCZ01_05565 [Elusimicrobia bacterium]|nr:MAG: hypothetical protein A2X37_11465 [Elusimicrobia bacterium GWA2_66_18]HAZ07990.1 hypothetical protein [Elusimicrobiota bacterium]
MRKALVFVLAACCLSSGVAARAAFIAEIARAPSASGTGALAKWTRPLGDFLNASAPSLDSVRELSGDLSRIDLGDPAALSQLEPLRAQLRAAASSLLASPDPTSRETDLHAASLKLTLLNQPSVRSLLTEEQQGRIPVVFWIYQNHLIEDVRLHDWAASKLSVAEKIAGISKALDDSRVLNPDGKPAALRPDAGVEVEILDGDISQVKAHGLISAVQLSGFCRGGINAMLERVGGPGFGRQVSAATPLRDGQTLLVRGDSENKGRFENVVFVADDMRRPLRELVSLGLKAADAAGLTQVSLPALRAGWNFGFLEKTYEQVVSETVKGVNSFLAGRPANVKKISLVVHSNPRLLDLMRAAAAPADLEPLASSLRQNPINGASYASEADFLFEFAKAARKKFEFSEGLSPQAQLLLGLERQGDQGSSIFLKNLAIVSDDLYLWSDARNAPERLALAGLRARLGAASVKASGPTNSEPVAPMRGLWISRLAPASFGSALREALEFISARDLAVAGFPSVIERWARSPALRARIGRFEEGLAALNDGFDTLPETSVWRLALEVNDGDVLDAAEMLGGIIGQTKRPLRYVEREFIPRFPEALGAQEDFVKAARCYYMLGLIHEKGLARFGRSGLYPPGSSATGPKFWHFYGAAMVASRLHRHPGYAGKAAGIFIGAAYEAVSLRHNLALLRSRGPFRGLALGLADAGRDIIAHAQGHDFGRGLFLGAASERVPIVVAGGARARLRRARGYALNAWWQLWWEAGPPAAKLWNGYRARLKAAETAGLKPTVIDPKGLFISLRLLGLSVRTAAVAEGVASDETVLSEARALFARHIAAGDEARAAFNRFLDRARLYNPLQSRAKLRSLAAYCLRESSVLPSEDLAAYYDGLARDDAALAEAGARSAQVLADFKQTADRIIREANRSVRPGRRVLGFVVSGSFAKGGPRPGSDLDLQLVTEDGGAQDGNLISELEGAWAKLQPTVPLEVFSNAYLPPDPGLIATLHPEPYLIVSPYPEAVALLSREETPARAPPEGRDGALSRVSRVLLRGWLRALLTAGESFLSDSRIPPESRWGEI